MYAGHLRPAALSRLLPRRFLQADAAELVNGTRHDELRTLSLVNPDCGQAIVDQPRFQLVVVSLTN